MNHECDHRTYYAQFVTEDIRERVRRDIGLERILRSVDEHFNDIPLRKWDILAGGFRTQLCAQELRLHGDFPTLAGAVCILKEAAKQLKERYHATHVTR
jgi:hypothetical protein